MAIAILFAAVLKTPQPAYASESTFRIGLQIFSADSGPPTVPTGLSGTPDTISQISLNWLVSTDDVAVYGYVLYRDGIALATTTSNAYVDTGLTASTTYQYAVNAFDQAGYYSATSSTISVTTLSIPPAATTTPTATSTSHHGSGFVFPNVGGVPIAGEGAFRISNIQVVPHETTLTVSWTTNFLSDSKLSWGRTVDTEIGSMYRIQAEQYHTMVISQLQPGTLYNLHIQSATPTGVITSEGLSVSTILPYEELFQNPTNVTITPSGSGLNINWSTSNTASSSDVRVVRSDKFYPQDPYDGKVIYEGNGTQATDDSKRGPVAYYSLFTRDDNGKFSSGVTSRYGADTPSSDDVVRRDLSGLEVLQHDIRIYADSKDTFKVTDDAVVQVILPSASEDSSVKLVTISVMPREGLDTNNISYIFTYSREKGGYVVYIPQGALAYGKQDFKVTFFGNDNKAKAIIEGSFDKKKSGISFGSSADSFLQYINSFVNRSFYILLLILLIIGGIFYIKRH